MIGPALVEYRLPRSKARASLVLTDIGYLVAVGFALFVAVDPLDWFLEKIIFTKHLALFLTLPFLIMTLVAGRVFRYSQSFPRISGSFRPLLGFALFVVAGSLYARFHLGIQNTFLFTGIYMLAAPLAAYMLIHAADARRMLRAYLAMLLTSGMVIIVGLALNYGVQQVYHELEYLVPPLAVFFAFSTIRAGLRWSGICLFLVAAVLFKKNTGYLTGLLVMAYLLWFRVWPDWRRQDSLHRMAKVYALAMALLILAAAALFLWAHKDTYLPSGNPQYRLLTYEKTWEKFIDSPLWGTAYSGAATEEFTGFDTGRARNVLPSHSDILDILANGGLLGVFFWLWALSRIAKLAYTGILHPGNWSHPLAPYAHMLACMSLAAVLTYAFNPILLQPARALLVWTNLGMLAASALLFNSEVTSSQQKSYA